MSEYCEDCEYVRDWKIPATFRFTVISSKEPWIAQPLDIKSLCKGCEKDIRTDWENQKKCDHVYVWNSFEWLRCHKCNEYAFAGD